MLKSLDLKSILLILLLGSLTVLVSCSEQESQSTVATTDEPATTEEAEPEVDPALARRSTTHWINEEPIGNNQGPVSIEDLASGNNNPEQWLHYGGDYNNFRHSPIDELNVDTVGQLQVAWSLPTGTDGQFALSPIVYDGIMYVSAAHNRLFAVNAETGELYWRYDHKQPDDLRICCGPANRGVAISGNMVIMATLDAHLLAFDRLSGEILWDITIGDYKKGLSATAAPLIVKNNVIIGIGGGEYGVRGFFDAYDLDTQERVWRVYTIPADGEPGVETWADDSYKRGGSPTWSVGAFDAATNLIYWTTGNPSPDWNGDSRMGDNLYSDSLLAVDADTGELKWYFQFTPHDVWDYDGNTTIFLVDMNFAGQQRQAVVQANRNGYFYILDRVTGEFLQATQYVEQLNWATIDENGRPDPNPLAFPQTNPDYRICPGLGGGMNGAWAGALNPDLKMVYIPTIENCMKMRKGISVYVEGQTYMGGGQIDSDASMGEDYGHLTAIDIETGEIKWRHMESQPMKAGVVSTAGGVVISGNQDGMIFALNAETGEVLWEFRAGGGIRSQPIVYKLNGEVYMAIGAGNRSRRNFLPGGGQLFVFKLPRQ